MPASYSSARQQMPNPHPIDNQQRQHLRREMRERRRAVDADSRSTAAAALMYRLGEYDPFKVSDKIAAYLAMPEEIDLDPVIAECWRSGKRVYLPHIVRDSMKFHRFDPDTPVIRGPFGIRQPDPGVAEPIDPGQLDLVLVPLVAFDRHGARLGMGGGYYDRTFSFRRQPGHQRPRLIGVAYELQRVERLEVLPWDVPLDEIFTEASRTVAEPEGHR